MEIKEYRSMQKKLKELYEQIFGLRPVYTFGWHITHFTDDVGSGRPLVKEFARQNNLKEEIALKILEGFIDEYRNLSFNIDNYIQEDTKISFEEIETVFNKLISIRNNKKYIPIFKYKSYIDFQKG